MQSDAAQQGINQPVHVKAQSVGFDPEFLRKYSKANYDAILAASEEAYKNGYCAPNRNDTPCERVTANTAAAGSSENTATGVQPANDTAPCAAVNNSTQTAQHAVLPESQSQSHTEDAQIPQSQSHTEHLEAAARTIATEQVQKECNISAAPTDAGYRHLYVTEINRRTQHIARNLRRRQVQRGNRRISKVESNSI